MNQMYSDFESGPGLHSKKYAAGRSLQYWTAQSLLNKFTQGGSSTST